MLHGMLPAAFFATLMRRYLDSIAETQQFVNSSSVLGPYLGTSAMLATAGIAVYGLSRFKKRNPVISEIRETSLPLPESNDVPSGVQLMRQKPSRTKIRKRRRKGKQWFLKNMKHYKSKYGRRIEQIDTDDSDDEPSDIFQQHVYESDSENDFNKNPTESKSADRLFPDDFSCKISNLNEEDSIVASKDDLDEVDENAKLAMERSSSLDLKDLLRENFEMQQMRKRGGRTSSLSGHSRRSSRSRNSSKSQSHHSRSSSLHSGYTGKKSSRRGPKSDKYKSSKSWRKSVDRSSLGKNVPKKTRSGKCYD